MIHSARNSIWKFGRKIGLTSFCSVAIAGALFGLIAPVPVFADAQEGERSYAEGRKDEAIRLLRRAAWQDNNFFAQLRLGDIYAKKREDDKGFHDPVEAFVWYFLAGRNSMVMDHLHIDETAQATVEQLALAEQSARQIYTNLLQDERIDARNRIIYIQACRGGEGQVLLGMLHDPNISARHQGDPIGQMRDLPKPIVRPFGAPRYPFSGLRTTNDPYGSGGYGSTGR
jgi:hypothetical protein